MPYAFGAAAGGAFPQLIITNSRTWVPPQDGNVCIHVVGAGGGGSGRNMRGGGGGAYVKLNSLAVTTSGSFSITIGAGATPGASTWQAATGGTSSVSGTGISATLTAGGGIGANWNTSPAGGTGANGDVRYNGGTGGSGGGAVGVYANGNSGGSATSRSGQTDAQAGDSGIGSSRFGEICGGTSSNNHYNYGNDVGQSNGEDGGDLCGGGGISVAYQSNGATNKPRGGNGGVGGGGGGTHNEHSPNGNYGGHGGDGIVLIQYLPW